MSYRGRLLRVDGMVAKVKGTEEAEDFKLLICPEETATRYRQEVPPHDDETVQVRGKHWTYAQVSSTELTLSFYSCRCGVWILSSIW